MTAPAILSQVPVKPQGENTLFRAYRDFTLLNQVKAPLFPFPGCCRFVGEYGTQKSHFLN